MGVTLKVVDRQRGLWTNIVKGRRGSWAFQQRVIPDARVMKLIGNEMINQTRGSTRNTLRVVPAPNIISIVRDLGFVINLGGIPGETFRQVIVVATPFGEYPTGIKKGVSPRYEIWEPLSPATLKHRRFKGISRGETFILRETGMHLYNTIKIQNLKTGGKWSEVRVGWVGANAQIASAQHTGFYTATEWFGRPPTDAHKVPARPLMGMSAELEKNIRDFLHSFLR